MTKFLSEPRKDCQICGGTGIVVWPVRCPCAQGQRTGHTTIPVPPHIWQSFLGSDRNLVMAWHSRHYLEFPSTLPRRPDLFLVIYVVIQPSEQTVRDNVDVHEIAIQAMNPRAMRRAKKRQARSSGRIERRERLKVCPSIILRSSM